MTACCFEATCWPRFLNFKFLWLPGLLPLVPRASPLGCPKTSCSFLLLLLTLTAGPAFGCWQLCLLGWMASEHLQGNLPLSVWASVLLGPSWFPSCPRRVAIPHLHYSFITVVDSSQSAYFVSGSFISSHLFFTKILSCVYYVHWQRRKLRLRECSVTSQCVSK